MENINFEQALKELETIVTKLEKGDEPLDTSLTLFERGVYLTKTCLKSLENAEQKVMILTKDENGIKEANFTPEEE